MIEFGAYDQKISFISFGEQSDDYGGYIPNVTNVLNTYAAVRQLKGSNSLDAAQLELPKTYLFKVQFRSDFIPNESLQIMYRGSNYAIKSIVEDEDRNQREWIITAVKV